LCLPKLSNNFGKPKLIEKNKDLFFFHTIKSITGLQTMQMRQPISGNILQSTIKSYTLKTTVLSFSFCDFHLEGDPLKPYNIKPLHKTPAILYFQVSPYVQVNAWETRSDFKNGELL
jgi:hypothetical protein